MHSFKKILLSSISFVFCVLLICTTSFFIIDCSNAEYYYDLKYRQENSGSYDCFFCGASQCLTSIMPSVADKELNVNSYSISGFQMPMYARKLMLEKEIERNPVNKVIIEVSYNTFTRNSETETCEGDIYVVPRIDGLKARFSYIKDNFKPSELPILLGKSLNNAYHTTFKCIKSTKYDDNRLNKGYSGRESNDISIPENDIEKKYKCDAIDLSWNKENINIFSSIIAFLKQKKIDITVVTVPIAESFIWSNSGLDENYKRICSLTNELGVKYYDYNLAKNRFELYNDNNSFNNSIHMSNSGAVVFTKEMCRTLKLSEEEIRNLFYNSYEDVINNMQYKKSLINN